MQFDWIGDSCKTTPMRNSLNILSTPYRVSKVSNPVNASVAIEVIWLENINLRKSQREEI
jgi:hypothetical protein